MKTKINDDAALKDFDMLPDAAFVRVGTVARLYSTSAPSVWRWVKLGVIPTPRKLGPQVTAWNVGELRRAFAGVASSTPVRNLR